MTINRALPALVHRHQPRPPCPIPRTRIPSQPVDPPSNQRDAGNADVPRLSGARVGDRLEAIVEGTGDNLVLLSLGQVVEVHSVTGNANGELGVLLRVSLGVD